MLYVIVKYSSIYIYIYIYMVGVGVFLNEISVILAEKN